MENQHRQISGYRELSQEEIDLMNAIKAEGERLGELVAKVKGTAGIDPRWAAEANTDLQKGIMCLVRAVAKPTTF